MPTMSSVLIVDVLEVQNALTVSECAQRPVMVDVKREAIAIDLSELLLSLSCSSIEALDANGVITDTSEDKVLIWDEAHAIDDRVENFPGFGVRPGELSDRVLEVTHVPHLDALPQGAAARDHIVIVLADVHAVARYRSLEAD